MTTFSDGIGRITRSQWSGERNTPNSVQQAPGFEIGIVMDDKDDQNMHRLMVYVPGFSSAQSSDQVVPDYGGTTPDRQADNTAVDIQLRDGWILCHPLFPYAGSDEHRVSNALDGRSGKEGFSNSYGMSYQPRIGDWVGVLFAHSDPSSGFWVGCIPKQAQNSMVPGVPGYTPDQMNPDQTNGLAENANVPSVEQPLFDDNSSDQFRWAASEFQRKLELSGLINDPQRGAGTSGSTRESPSYVMGFKSPGWNYDSEKFNKNINGTRFIDEEDLKYRYTNTTGHQFVFDDHPDYQSVRMRSSGGSQLLFNDAATVPYVYMATGNGSAWIELDENGCIHIYSDNDMSHHTKGNYNVTADGDINMEAGKNVNILSDGDGNVRFRGDGQLKVGEKDNGTLKIETLGDAHWKAAQSINTSVGEDYNMTVTGSHITNVSGDYGVKSDGLMSHYTGSDYTLLSDGVARLDGGYLFLNSGPGPLTSDAIAPIGTSYPALNKVYGAPTPEQSRAGQVPEMTEHLSPIVPQHEPWPVHFQSATTKGQTGIVTQTPSTLNRGITIENDDECGCSANARENYRNGAASPDATKPTPFVGMRMGTDAIWDSEPYSETNNTASYVPIRALRIGEGIQPASMKVTDDTRNYLKSKETFSPTPYQKDDGNWAIGFGTDLKLGMNVGGINITSDVLRTLNRFGSFAGLSLSLDSATELFNEIIDEVGDFVSSLFTNDDVVTEEQVGMLTSVVNSTGIETFQQLDDNPVSALKEGSPEKVVESCMNTVYVDGKLSCSQVARRREELETGLGNISEVSSGFKMEGTGEDVVKSTPPELETDTVDMGTVLPYSRANMLKYRAYILADPSIDTIMVGQWLMTQDSYNAIITKANEYNIPVGFMFAMAAQESGFVHNVDNGTSRGLFQFVRSTWGQYSTESYDQAIDPLKNSDAASRLVKDNADYLTNNGVPISATTLYGAHFMGARGFSDFYGYYEANPNDPSTNDPRVQRWVTNEVNASVFLKKDGQPKTFSDVIGFLSKKMERADYFSGYVS